MNTPTGAEGQITDHCVQRYIERVKPDLEPPAARRELDQLKQVGTIATSAPAWAREADPAAYYLRSCWHNARP